MARHAPLIGEETPWINVILNHALSEVEGAVKNLSAHAGVRLFVTSLLRVTL